MGIIKVEPTKEQEFQSFDIEIKDITWKMRCELNDSRIEVSKEGMPSFTWWGNIVLKYSNLKEDELHKYSTDEIIAIANTIFEIANKKK